MQASLITFLKWHVKHTHVVEIIQPKLRQSPLPPRSIVAPLAYNSVINRKVIPHRSGLD
jgi:hypothetical protein